MIEFCLTSKYLLHLSYIKHSSFINESYIIGCLIKSFFGTKAHFYIIWPAVLTILVGNLKLQIKMLQKVVLFQKNNKKTLKNDFSFASAPLCATHFRSTQFANSWIFTQFEHMYLSNIPSKFCENRM